VTFEKGMPPVDERQPIGIVDVASSHRSETGNPSPEESL
jgi:hypothetical protein